MSRVKRLVALIVAVVALALAATASAHPLGNFTINHYNRVQPSGDRIYVLYVLDMAEIPTFRARQTMTSLGGYASATSREVAGELQLAVDGKRLSLTPRLRKQ